MAQPLDPRVEIGHVHLRTRDLDRSLAFYSGALGFEVTDRRGASAAFLGAGGFRHHIELTVTGSNGAPYRFAIRYPDRVALANALLRLEQAGIAIDRATDNGVSEALYVRDPDGNEVELYYDRPSSEQARGTNGAEAVTREKLDLAALRSAAQDPQGRPQGPSGPGMLSDAGRQRLRDLRSRLLNLHKVLLEDTRGSYEMDRGRVGSNSKLLQLVIGDPWFAWLHSLSEIVVRIDETVDPGSPATQADAVALLDQVERLLTPSETGEPFARRYFDALQRQPAVVLAHADVRRALKTMREARPGQPPML
jgi:catechol 2,3-dioxygenase